jgi:hypothetical protein
MHALRESELREHMESYVTTELNRTVTNILEFKVDRNLSADEGSNILDLIEQTSEAISDVNRHAAERLALADSLAKRAVEQLRAAEQRVQKAEAERVAAEAAFSELCQRTENEYAVKLEQLEALRNDALARVARSESRICEAEARVVAAERRAKSLESTFKRIEEAVRNKLFGSIGRQHREYSNPEGRLSADELTTSFLK